MKNFSIKKLSPKLTVFIISILIVGIAVVSYAFVLVETFIGVTIPYNFTSGTTISSSQVNANFTALANQMPGIDWTTISQASFNARGSVVTLANVTITAPCSGYVVVRFDGQAYADAGDGLTLAASDTASWGSNDGNVTFYSDNKLYAHPFSHTRVYSVSAGSKTFYAVAQNYTPQGGSGVAGVYGTLTATFYPNRY
jgi:hypothetical protein